MKTTSMFNKGAPGWPAFQAQAVEFHLRNA
jgi:hypothetical protein